MKMKSTLSNYNLQVDIGKKLFMEYNHEMLIRRFHLTADETWIYLDYLHTLYRINRKTGQIQEKLAGADITCMIPVTPYFPVLLQFWEGDEEFRPKLMLLWDENSMAFLHYETTYYLQGDLLERLSRQL